MNLNFPDFALSCINKIEDKGFEAWFVGGCVRDMLLGRAAYDIDITTNAQPSEIINIFDKTIPTGIKHGTVAVIIDENQIEVTTYRSEEGYIDSRHPNLVAFKNEIREDLSRRDFTINALAFHPKRKLLDLFDGINDLNNHIIKCVGDPKVRFNEDALRILRAFRFASQLNFKIEKKTEKAALALSDKLDLLSGERVLSELKKLLLGENFKEFSKLMLTDCFKHFGISSPKDDLSVLKNIKCNIETRLAIFLNLCGFDEELLKTNLKIDNISLKHCLSLKEIINSPIPKTKEEIKHILIRFGTKNFEIYLEYLRAKGLDVLILENSYQEIIKNHEPYEISQLKINGEDILMLGFKGNEVGEKLIQLINQVIINPDMNKKELLIGFLKN